MARTLNDDHLRIGKELHLLLLIRFADQRIAAAGDKEHLGAKLVDATNKVDVKLALCILSGFEECLLG